MKNAHAASQPNSSPHGTLEELAQGYLTSIETQRVLANASMHHIQSFKSALAAAQGELAKASEETSNAKSECEAAKREVWKQADSARREREEMMKEVLKANANANKKVEAMRAQVDELQSKLQAAHLDLRDFDWLSAKYASLKAQYAEAQVELKELRQEKVVSPSLDTPTLRHLQMNDPMHPKTPGHRHSPSGDMTSERTKDLRSVDRNPESRPVDVEMSSNVCDRSNSELQVRAPSPSSLSSQHVGR